MGKAITQELTASSCAVTEPAAFETVPAELGAFKRVVSQSAVTLYRLAARIVGIGDAEDVLQESYIRAWDALRRGDFDGRAQLETWLYRIVCRCALDALRRTCRQRRRENASLESDDEGRPLDARTALRELSEWLDQLPPEQRVALVLKEVEGLTSAEVGRALGISEGAVEQRLVRARAALRVRRERE